MRDILRGDRSGIEPRILQIAASHITFIAITPPYGLEARPRNRQLQQLSSYINRHLARPEDTTSRLERERERGGGDRNASFDL